MKIIVNYFVIDKKMDTFVGRINLTNSINLKPMRKLHTTMQALLLLVLTAGVFVGCRKGEDDPWLTFRGRKARMVGKWSVTSGMVSRGALFTANNGNQVVGTSSSRYSEKRVEQTNYYSTSQKDSTWTRSGDFSGSVEIFRDGTYKMTHTEIFKASGNIPELNNSVTITGYWSFTGGANDTRKREQLVLQEVSVVPAAGVASVNNNPVPSAIYNIRQLKSKEIVLDYTNDSSDALDTSREEWTWSLSE